ncbi:MAG: hypothetical protein CVV25_02595 [Ignavibacteriae bacterium HGW-Ignavibacteriae-4]|jgi:hypothetical protein|nr:MAG: hypothetical protein CVV25_02595 [Ignavibacteriae bacterium HGW-Ignavibacteriae-4]
MRTTLLTIIISTIFSWIPAHSSCYNIHKLLEVTSLYGRTIDFNKEIIFEKGRIQVFKDFVLVKGIDSGILEKIEKGNLLLDLKNLLKIDTLDISYNRQKGVPIKELAALNDSVSIPNTIYFYAEYELEFIVFAEVVFNEDIWKNGEILNNYKELELNGFEISNINTWVGLYTFRCDEKGELHHIRTDTYATYH